MLSTEDMREVVAVTASISTILQFLSGILVCQKFVQKGSTGDASSIPFISGCLSTSVWLRYGFLIQEHSIILVNTIGATLFFAYVVTFYMYSLKKSTVAKQFLICILLLMAILTYSTMGNDTKESLEETRNKIGTICCVMSIIFFAAPFSSLLHVIKVGSAESLPFPLIMASFIVCLQWYAYGCLIEDTFVQIPNFLGAVLSGLQLTLFCLFPKKYKSLEQI